MNRRYWRDGVRRTDEIQSEVLGIGERHTPSQHSRWQHNRHNLHLVYKWVCAFLLGEAQRLLLDALQFGLTHLWYAKLVEVTFLENSLFACATWNVWNFSSCTVVVCCSVLWCQRRRCLWIEIACDCCYYAGFPSRRFLSERKRKWVEFVL